MVLYSVKYTVQNKKQKQSIKNNFKKPKVCELIKCCYKTVFHDVPGSCYYYHSLVHMYLLKKYPAPLWQRLNEKASMFISNSNSFFVDSIFGAFQQSHFVKCIVGEAFFSVRTLRLRGGKKLSFFFFFSVLGHQLILKSEENTIHFSSEYQCHFEKWFLQV